MSEENSDPLYAFGKTYGIDMQYDFNQDGTVDLLVDESGDIRLVGGVASELIEIRRKNAVQQILLRILTPRETLVDEEGNTVGFGSDVYTLVGQKDTSLNKMAVRAYILAALQDYDWIETITKIDVDFPDRDKMSLTIGFKLIDDNAVIEQMIEFGG